MWAVQCAAALDWQSTGFARETQRRPPLPGGALDRPREYWVRAAFVRVPASHTPVRGEFGAASRHRGGAGQPRRREAHRSGRDPSALKQRKRTTALPATSGINTSA